MFKNAMSMSIAERALSKDSAQVLANPRGTTPLMLVCSAAGSDAAEAAKQLLQSRADVSARDYRGWSCLHHACRNGCDEVARHLLSAGANAKERTTDGKTTVMLAAEGGHTSVLKVLAENDKDFSHMVTAADNAGSTALHGACRSGDVAGIKLLVVCKAKIVCKDKHGKQPLALLCATGSMAGVKFLLEKKARVDVADEELCTPLHQAVLNNHDRLALHLVQQKADANAASENGETPYKIGKARQLSKFMREIDHRIEIAALAAAQD